MRYEDALTLAVLIAGGSFVLWLLFRRGEWRQREQIQRNETLRILVQKFNTSDEFVGFVNSDAGRLLLTPVAQKPKSPASSVLRFVQVGIVLTLIGVAMLIHAHGMAGMTDINFVNQRNDLSYWGTVGAATGLGLLIAAGITRSLGRAWGLFDRETK